MEHEIPGFLAFSGVEVEFGALPLADIFDDGATYAAGWRVMDHDLWSREALVLRAVWDDDAEQAAEGREEQD